MKIAMCIFALNDGGIRTLLEVLFRGFILRGHSVQIITTYQKGNFFERAIEAGWPLKDTSRNDVCLGERIKSLHEELLGSYDVVMFHHSHEAQLVLPALEPRVIRFGVQHNAVPTSARKSLINSRYFDAMAGVSGIVADTLRKNSEGSLRVVAIPNGLDMPRDLPLRDRDPNQILFVGRLDEIDKNVLILPRIAEELLSSNLNCFRIKIVGDGPAKAALIDEINSRGVQDCVSLVGPLEHRDAMIEMASSEFVLLPSRREGLPFTLIEAMSCGAIPIVSEIPIHRWMLGADAEILTAKVGFHPDFAQRILDLYGNRSLRDALRERLVQRHRENFSEASCVKRYLLLIDELRRIGKDHGQVPISDIPLSIGDRLKRTWFFRAGKRWQRQNAGTNPQR